MKPKNFHEGIALMERFFVASESKGINAIIQLNVTGDEPGTWHFVINDGVCEIKEGKPDQPARLSIETRSEVWLAIMRGERNGPEVFLTGQAVASGDMALLIKFGKLFPQKQLDSSD